VVRAESDRSRTLQRHVKVIQIQKTGILIVAAGRGHRAGTGLPKQYRTLGGIAVLRRTLLRFQETFPEAAIRCVIHPDDRNLYERAVVDLERLEDPVHGGDTRQQSVLNGLRAFSGDNLAKVLIHDAARPFVDPAVIKAVFAAISENVGAIAASPIVDTIKRADTQGRIDGTVPRDRLWAAQTPQGFSYNTILAAHEKAASERIEVTDDAALSEWAGLPVVLVESGRSNIKLTTEQDFTDAETQIMAQKQVLPDIRVGHGYDVHAFEPGTEVILGGISIPHDLKLKGHSDADVALHTITDAIYGAIGDGDIGHHFPPSDPQWKGTASDVFLKHAVGQVRRRNGRISNVDLTIICEEPKIGPHRDLMRQRISEIMDHDRERISVKATTTERLGFTGRSEGIAATATVTVILPASPGSDGGKEEG